MEARIEEATREAKEALGPVNFADDRDWLEALDLVQKLIAARIRVQVQRGQWSDAGVLDVRMLEDMTVRASHDRNGIGIQVRCPAIFAFLAGREITSYN